MALAWCRAGRSSGTPGRHDDARNRPAGVDYLLAGSVRWAGAEVARGVSASPLELLRAQDERQLWSTTYDREITDIFAIQSDIAEQVIERLGVTLHEGERTRLSAQPTTSHEAYTLYLKGRYFESKRTEANIKDRPRLLPTGRSTWIQAIPAPGWGSPMGGCLRGWYSRLAPRETWPKAKSAAMPGAGVRQHAGGGACFDGANSLRVRSRLDRCRARVSSGNRSPTPATRPPTTGTGGSCRGWVDTTKPLQQAVTARALDPLSPIIQTWIGLRYYFAGKYDAAIAEYRKALELDPDSRPPTGTSGGRTRKQAGSRKASRKPNERWRLTREVCSIWPLSVTPMPGRE